MRYLLFFFFFTPVMAQQLVIPDSLNPEQGRTYKKIAESVSAPCCSNAIPIAYHESGMAIGVRNQISDALLAGKSEAEIWDELKAMRFGPEETPLIFAIPDEASILGQLTWLSPLIVFIIGAVLIGFFFKNSKNIANKKVDENLINRYNDYIKQQVSE